MSQQPSLASRLARKLARVIPIRRKHPETTSITKVLSQSSDEGSFGRRAREYGIIGLSVALPLSEAVPVVGGPIKAAIGGLLEVLKRVEVSILSTCTPLHPDNICGHFGKLLRTKKMPPP